MRRKKDKGTLCIFKPAEISDRYFTLLWRFLEEFNRVFLIYGCTCPSKRNPGATSLETDYR